jgi:hypothetical protein
MALSGLWQAILLQSAFALMFTHHFTLPAWAVADCTPNAEYRTLAEILPEECHEIWR